MRNRLPVVVDEKLIEAEEDAVIDLQFLIQEMLLEKEMTQAQLADRIGVSKARLSQLMRAEANPTFRTAARLFKALGDDMKICRKSRLRSAEGEQSADAAWEVVYEEATEPQQKEAPYAWSWWKERSEASVIRIVHSNDDRQSRTLEAEEFEAA